MYGGKIEGHDLGMRTKEVEMGRNETLIPHSSFLFPFDPPQEFTLIDQLHAQAARFFQLATGIVSGNNETRFLGNATRNTTTVRFDQLSGLLARQGWQRPREDDRHAA